MMANRQRQSGRVWVMDDLGNLKPYVVRPGITDNTYSEITRSELKEGMKIIIGLETPQPRATPTAAGPNGRPRRPE